MNAIITKHKLNFEACPWPRNPAVQLFRIGTCHGQWMAKELSYVIISVMNEVPGNGHLEDVFQWFEHSCKRDKKQLVMMEFFNKKFKEHCIKKRGFREFGENNLIKFFI